LQHKPSSWEERRAQRERLLPVTALTLCFSCLLTPAAFAACMEEKYYVMPKEEEERRSPVFSRKER